MEKQILFQADQGGYALYRIPTMVATGQGTLLAFCEARKTARGDWGQIDILLRRSSNGGQTWDTPRPVAQLDEPVPKNSVALQQNLAGEAEQTFNNPVAIVDRQSGTIHFLHCAEYGRAYYKRSEDEGLTWSEPVEITETFEAFRTEYDWRVLATGPCHGIQLENGRLIVPVWLSTGTGGHAHRPSCVTTIYSDDHGQTWQAGEIVVHHSERVPNPSETVALELVDGRVMLNIRNESAEHRRLVSLSPDGASDWSEPVFDQALFEPVCCASLIRLPSPPTADQTRILFANPDSRQSQTPPKSWGAWPRENLTLRLSYDEGQTWPLVKVLDPGPGGYSDLGVDPDGTIYCLYESEGTLLLARFNLAWLETRNGQD